MVTSSLDEKSGNDRGPTIIKRHERAVGVGWQDGNWGPNTMALMIMS